MFLFKYCASIKKIKKMITSSNRNIFRLTGHLHGEFTMMTSSNGNIFFALLALCAGNSPATGEFPSQRPETRSFEVFFDLCLKKRLSKQSRGWWFETPSRPSWRHCNDRSPFTGEFRAQRAMTRGFDIWVNNGEAGDLRRHRAHYDGTIMSTWRNHDMDYY